eukprot:Amastigsp_a741_325.p2 type:complete len:233 gc:universal Amastigsp_a741_325:34-732(+)
MDRIRKNPVFARNGVASHAFNALAIGLFFGFGIALVVFVEGAFSVGWYMVTLATFHFLEYFLTAIFHPDTLSIDSFLLNHSREYWVALIASWCEFFIELYLFPGLKGLWPLAWLGLVVVVAAQALRSAAMFAAARNFTHIVQETKRDEHELVTTGLYAYVRHPSYVGFFYWSVGSQLLLLNPICVVGFAYASWKFFEDRIRDEETALSAPNFFGEKYEDYRRRVPSGIPFLK